MSIDERLRLNIHTRLSELIGSNEADALMVHMFSVPWHDVATKDDLRVLSADLRSEMAELRTELRTEMAELRTDLRTEMADLRTDLRTEMAELRTDLHKNAIGQTRWLTGYVSALAAVMLTIAQLLG